MITDDLRNEIEKTVHFAVGAHTGQFRKDGITPFIVHPFEVWSLIRSWGVESLDVWKAALCHDILEDCGDVSFIGLASAIGEPAAKICQELTFLPDHNSGIVVKWQKEKYIEAIASKSIDAVVVKCADRICNTRDFMRGSPDYAQKYWQKGQPIFIAQSTRAIEITTKFGPDVCQKILRDYAAVTAQIRA